LLLHSTEAHSKVLRFAFADSFELQSVSCRSSSAVKQFPTRESVCTASSYAGTHTHASSHALLRSRACNAGGRTHRGGESPQVVVGKEEPLQSKLVSQWDSRVVRRLQRWRAFRARTATAGGGNKGSTRRLSALPFAHSPLLVQGFTTTNTHNTPTPGY